MSDENPDVKIPVDEDGVEEIADDGEQEPRVSDRQRRNIAEAQARLIGDL